MLREFENQILYWMYGLVILGYPTLLATYEYLFISCLMCHDSSELLEVI